MTRQELYHLIWSKPISHISKEINRPESELKKVCSKFNIPTPSNGHWSKLQFNKESPQIPLPELEDEDLKQLVDVFEEKQEEISHLKKLKLRTLEIEQDKRLNLKVPDRVNSFDSIVDKAKEELSLGYSKRSYQSDDFVYPSEEAFSIAVSKEAISRAVRIVNTLVLALQKRGHSFKCDYVTEVIIYNEPIGIKFREKREKYMKKSSFGTNEYTAYKPTGILYFSIGRWSPEKIYSDSDKVKLEDRISQIIAYLEIFAEKKVQERIENQAWQREYENKKLEKENQINLIETENEKIKQLQADSKNWVKANELRDYINALERKAIATQTLSQETKDYINWARMRADELDPLEN